jgi:hypothetical protein
MNDWWDTCRKFDIEDQYRFDPDQVAEILDSGADVATLSNYFCERMVDDLEESLVRKAMVDDLEENSVAKDVVMPDLETELYRPSTTEDLDGRMTPTQSDLLEEGESNATLLGINVTSDVHHLVSPIHSHVEGLASPSDRLMVSGDGVVPDEQNLMIPSMEVTSQSPGAAVPKRMERGGSAFRRFTMSRSQMRRESISRDADLVRATRRSLATRHRHDDITDKLTVVEEALAAAHKHHRLSVTKVAKRALGESPDSPEVIDVAPCRPQNFWEDRIQEVLSLAQAQFAEDFYGKTSGEGRHKADEALQPSFSSRCKSGVAKDSIAEKKSPIREDRLVTEGTSDDIGDQFAKAMRALKERAVERAARIAPNQDDLLPGEGKVWIVIGGEHVNGIIVRQHESLASKVLPVRLAFGATIEELDLIGNRLHYRRLRGDGPNFGWVSVELPGKHLVTQL